MQRLLVSMIMILFLTPSINAATGVYANGTFTYGNMTINLSEWDVHYNFRVNITVSGSHKANYTTVFSKDGKNFTINVSKYIPMPNNIPKPNDWKFDAPMNSSSVRLDPRTCPNDIAFCYQVILHAPQNRTTFGKNLSGVSSYLLPSKRVREFVCVGNDLNCVAKATNCFCPESTIGSPPIIYEGGSCTSAVHICQSTYAGFSRCLGNLSACRSEHLRCACGSDPFCPSEQNTCLTFDHKAEICRGKLPDCLGTHSTCFCGPEALHFLRQSCSSLTHQCTQSNKTIMCKGTFVNCALQYDKCDC